MSAALVYLHGFLSSPASAKGRLLEAACRGRARFAAPDLNLPPFEADRLVDETIKGFDPASLTIVGSSLGGFYAARAAVKTGARAVLLNPCIDPWVFVKGETGPQKVFGTERVLDVKESYSDDLRSLAEAVSPLDLKPGQALAVLSTGDEVLDWRKAQKAYAHLRQVILPGADHRIARFAAVLPRVMDFALSGF